MMSLADRLWAKVDKNGPTQPHMTTPCWAWLGTPNENGYGRLGQDAAHRVSFFVAHGRWPEPCALHRCDYRLCVRPDHLYEGTKKENALDREDRRRGNHATGARHGRRTRPELTARGEDHYNAKLTDVDAWCIRDLFAQGTLASALAEAYDITEVHVWQILHGTSRAAAGGPLVPQVGYRRGANHGNALYSSEQVASMRAEYAGKYGDIPRLAEKYGGGRLSVRRVVLGLTYKEAG
jgi:HNH endonuclease